MKKVFLTALAAATIFASCEKGCMDETATNYNADADKADNSLCQYNTTLGENQWQDPRDGKIYQTVEINGVTWMAENLAYQTGNQIAYDNDEANVAEHGYMYNYTDAQTAIPSGWHMATKDEWEALEQYVNDDVTNLVVGGSLGLNLSYSGYSNATLFEGLNENGECFGAESPTTHSVVSFSTGSSSMVITNGRTDVLFRSVRCILD